MTIPGDAVAARRTWPAILIGVVALVAALAAAWLFPRAFPIVSLEQSLTREIALARADSFFRAHALAPAGARRAVHFQGNDSLRTYVELAGGGADSLNALVRGRDAAPFSWSVRAFVPRNPREAHVEFAPDGRIIGFSRTLAEADRRPTISADSGQRLAELALGTWIDDRADRWRLVSSSYETRKTSERVDRTYTFERTDRRVGGAPIRAEVVVAGDAASKVRQYVEIPESFRRHYGEMRSANELLALLASLGALAIVIAGIVFLSKTAQSGVRWREAMIVGAVIGILTLAAGLNEMTGSWYGYDTATSPTSFQARIAMGALLTGALTGLLAGFTLAAAEAATRRAFPLQLDWWKLWRYRGTRDVAARVAGGYAVAAIGFAYVACFYLVTRTVLGWWVPSEMLDDPNLIATPLPWMSGIAMSLNAGVWEETLFRALPLSLLSLCVGPRPGRRWWMAAGIVVTALVFGFAHANYPSWPPYSRGVEIFLDACLWGVLVVTVGVPVTVIAHFAYDLVLFGLFATSGSAVEYRVSVAIIVLALLAPALAVTWAWVRQRGLSTAPDDAHFAAFRPTVDDEVVEAIAPRQSPHAMTTLARRLAVGAAIIAAVTALGRSSQPVLGPQFTTERSRVIATADSMLRARGADPARWHRLARTATDTLAAWPRFLRANKLIPRARRFATSYVPPTWWTVRYVHTEGAVAQRAEEWRVRVWPDGRPLDARHIIPDSARRSAALPGDVRRIALGALAREGVNTATLVEAEYKEKALPSRHDVTVTYTDTAVKLPAGAAARAWVVVAGDEPLMARRGVELPETFLRADRERQTSHALIAGLCGLLLAGGIITGAIFVARRRPMLVDDGTLERRETVAIIGTLVLLAIAGRLNALPSTLFSWDTSEPWGRFVGTTLLTLVSAIPLAFAAFGAWLGVAALRRRVGIPMLAGPPSRATSDDMLLAGLGLGSLAYALSRIGALLPSRGMPSTPSTLLDDAAPALSLLPALPSAIIFTVAFIAVPLLVIAGVTRNWMLRAVIAAAMIALSLAATIAVAPANDVDPARIALAIAAMAALALTLRAWGTRSAWSWIVAVLVQQGFGGLRQVVHAPVWQERVANGLLLILACVLIALIAQRTRSAPSLPPEPSTGSTSENGEPPGMQQIY